MLQYVIASTTGGPCTTQRWSAAPLLLLLVSGLKGSTQQAAPSPTSFLAGYDWTNCRAVTRAVTHVSDCGQVAAVPLPAPVGVPARCTATHTNHSMPGRWVNEGERGVDIRSLSADQRGRVGCGAPNVQKGGEYLEPISQPAGQGRLRCPQLAVSHRICEDGECV